MGPFWEVGLSATDRLHFCLMFPTVDSGKIYRKMLSSVDVLVFHSFLCECSLHVTFCHFIGSDRAEECTGKAVQKDVRDE